MLDYFRFLFYQEILILPQNIKPMDVNNLSLYQPKMEYRRFGKTNKNLSVITLGGMRYKHGWDNPRDEIPNDTLEQATDTVKKAFEHGINHIETAYGYKKSEHVYGKVLNEVLNIKRDNYHLMTKGNPKTADETRKMVEDQLTALQTDYFDFYGWHGMNNLEIYKMACKKGGPVEELHKLKKEGIIKHVGFSTHAPLDVIIKAIETDLFEFINLHYYYFFQRNKAAIDLAQTKDMGVFIISPNDKGGQLFNPPEKLKNLTKPFTPLQWNAKFCLSHQAIHTLTFGLPETASFDQLNGIFPASVPLTDIERRVKHLLEEEALKIPYTNYDGFAMEHDPSGINIPEILRFYKLIKAYHMTGFGKYRYNMFKENDHWYGGAFPTEDKLAKIDMTKCPKGFPLKEIIRETHEVLYRPKKG